MRKLAGFNKCDIYGNFINTFRIFEHTVHPLNPPIIEIHWMCSMSTKIISKNSSELFFVLNGLMNIFRW